MIKYFFCLFAAYTEGRKEGEMGAPHQPSTQVVVICHVSDLLSLFGEEHCCLCLSQI